MFSEKFSEKLRKFIPGAQGRNERAEQQAEIERMKAFIAEMDNKLKNQGMSAYALNVMKRKFYEEGLIVYDDEMLEYFRCQSKLKNPTEEFVELKVGDTSDPEIISNKILRASLGGPYEQGLVEKFDNDTYPAGITSQQAQKTRARVILKSEITAQGLASSNIALLDSRLEQLTGKGFATVVVDGRSLCQSQTMQYLGFQCVNKEGLNSFPPTGAVL